MKPFVIKAPANGKNTASIVAQVYDKAERRTKTAYVASFSVASSPDSTPTCIKLASAAAAAGFTLELATALVYPWLKLNSIYGQPKQFDPELVEQVRRELAASTTPVTAQTVVDETPEAQLLAALQAVNKASAAAQAAAKLFGLRQAISDEIINEYQRTWFTNQDMLTSLKSRKAFYRPNGWSDLRAQVVEEGRVYRKGDDAVAGPAKPFKRARPAGSTPLA